MYRSWIGLLLMPVAAVAQQQALPALPAVNVITTAEQACSLESQDAAGGLFVQCRSVADGAAGYTAVVEASEEGAIVAHGTLGCLYWTEDGKYRLQCADGVKVVVDGYMPPVTRKRRWYLFWR
jgi:hypothetical protein